MSDFSFHGFYFELNLTFCVASFCFRMKSQRITKKMKKVIFNEKKSVVCSVGTAIHCNILVYAIFLVFLSFYLFSCIFYLLSFYAALAQPLTVIHWSMPCTISASLYRVSPSSRYYQRLKLFDHFVLKSSAY